MKDPGLHPDRITIGDAALLIAGIILNAAASVLKSAEDLDFTRKINNGIGLRISVRALFWAIKERILDQGLNPRDRELILMLRRFLAETIAVEFKFPALRDALDEYFGEADNVFTEGVDPAALLATPFSDDWLESIRRRLAADFAESFKIGLYGIEVQIITASFCAGMASFHETGIIEEALSRIDWTQAAPRVLASLVPPPPPPPLPLLRRL